MRRVLCAFTLIEMLICAAIITILSGMAYYCYASAVEGGAVKLALPFLSADLGQFKYESTREKAVIVVEFPQGQDYYIVTKKGPKGFSRDKVVLDRRHSLGRRLYFRKYTWPDGKTAPRTFTFIPRDSPRGGTVALGTDFAEGKLTVAGNGLSWSN